MCRIDDECAWYVDSESEKVAETKLLCEDCLREIEPGETYVNFTCTPGPDYDGDEPRYIWLAQMERDLKEVTYGTLKQYTSWQFDETKPHFRCDEEVAEIWEYYGYHIFEEENPDIQEPDHVSCVQCRTANKWLVTICNQHTVMVTCQDLNDHTAEYDEDTLGPDFMMLNNLCRWKWQLNGALVSPQYVAVLTGLAINHAIAQGLQESAHT